MELALYKQENEYIFFWGGGGCVENNDTRPKQSQTIVPPVDEYMFTCLHILSVGFYKFQHIMLVSSSITYE